MEQYFKKSLVLAEIENLLDKGKHHEEYDCAYRDGNNGALYTLKGKLDTLEVKEVDLGKEIEKCLKRHNMLAVGKKDFTDIAKYFFELGLRAQKGE